MTRYRDAAIVVFGSLAFGTALYAITIGLWLLAPDAGTLGG